MTHVEMPFGLQEETIGLLIVIAVVLITLVIITLHERSQTTPPATQKSSKEEDTPSLKAKQPDLGHKWPRERPHEPVNVPGDSPPTRNDQPQLAGQPQQTIKDFIRHRLLPFLPSFEDEQEEEVEFVHESGAALNTSPRKLIDTAKGQRVRTQFAAILLYTHEEAENLELFEFKPPVNLDPTKEYVPDKRLFNNYIISRPAKRINRGKIDAEQILLDNFGSLKKAFKQENGDIAKIVLYSWFMPCPACTTVIIDKLSGLANKGIQVEVYYTARNSESEETQQDNRHQLEDHKISIDKESYPEYLQPANKLR